MQRVVVTGATGFIGQHLVKRLRQTGVFVYGLARRTGNVQDVQVEAVDLSKADQVQQWKQDKHFEVIFHLASDIPDLINQKAAEQSFKNNTSAMIHVLNLAAAFNSHLVYTSSSSIYGNSSNGDSLFREDTLPTPDNYYSTSKYLGELLCGQYAANQNLSYTALRIAAPYGPGSRWPTVINIFLESLLEAKNLNLYGSGARTQDFTYIDDVIESIWQAMTLRSPGVFNIAGGTPVSMKTLATYVLELLPDTVSQVVYSDKPDPQENYRGVFSIEKAREALAWSPKVGLPQGLRSTMAWLQQETQVK